MQYLFQRGSVWYVKTQGAKRVERSLRTSDRAQAEILALPFIQAHKAELLERKLRVATVWQRQYEPRPLPYPGPDGGLIVATERELTFYDAAGKLLRTEPNGAPAHQLVGGPLNLRPLANAYLEADNEAFGNRGWRPAVTKSVDDAILDSYLNFKSVTGYRRREAETTWALFRQLTNGKLLRKCNRDDGRALVAHLQSQGLKSASIKKRLVRLCAAVNFAMEEGKFEGINPFAGIVVAVGKDALRKLPLDDADLEACRKNLDTLSESDQLLFRLLTTTGMRLGEAFQINGELKERGVRYIEIGTKTESSRRKVPFPQHVLEYLPPVVNGPLFQGDANAASKRLNAFLRGSGVSDPAKTVHSLRHRAADKLRAVECPPNIRYELLGHTKTIAEGYGIGSPVTLLKKWIDLIDGI